MVERMLGRLDSGPWEVLKGKLLPYSHSKDGSYGWRQFWNTLNEARGYVLLKDRGFPSVTFIPPPKDKKKPKKGEDDSADLLGDSPTGMVILDVKTVNRSNNDIETSQRRIDTHFREATKIGKEERPGDIKDIRGFAEKLVQQVDRVSAFLWQQFDKPLQEQLQNLLGEPANLRSIEAPLVTELNRILDGRCIYEQKRFSGVRLHRMTEHLLDGTLQCAGFVCVNRCLLDDAYEGQLSRWSASVSGVELYCASPPIPAKFRIKCERLVQRAREQIDRTLERIWPSGIPSDKRIDKIVLLVVHRDFGCSDIRMSQLQAELQRQQTGFEVVCQSGDDWPT
jgi:hypothetical protein